MVLSLLFFKLVSGYRYLDDGDTDRRISGFLLITQLDDATVTPWQCRSRATVERYRSRFCHTQRVFGAAVNRLRGVYSDTTQLNSTSCCRHVHSVNNCHLSINVVTQLTQFVGHDVINKNTTDLAVRCSTGSVEFS